MSTKKPLRKSGDFGNDFGKVDSTATADNQQTTGYLDTSSDAYLDTLKGMGMWDA